MLRWDLKRHLAARHIANANQLALLAGLTYPVAKRIWQDVEDDAAIERLDSETYSRLVRALDVKPKEWWTLLRFTLE